MKYTRIFIAIAVTLLVPLSLFFLLDVGKKQKSLLPGYYKPVGLATYEKNGAFFEDTLYFQVPEIQLINQLADTVKLNNDLRGKVLVINTFFTQCGSICPEMSKNMSLLQKAVKKKLPDAFQFISISIDPGNDSVPALRNYANKYTVDHDKWWFLTGNSDSIFHYIKNDLGLILEGSTLQDLDHSNKIVLLDKERHIRGYYNALDPKELKKCAEDAIFLTMEKKKKKKQN